MKKHVLNLALVIVTAAFAFQTVDYLPVHSEPGVHAKTCCGRAVCTCKHAKGAFCPMRGKMNVKSSHADQESGSQHTGMKKACHFKAAKQETLSASVKLPKGAQVFTSAPCAADTPKTLLPQYAKDFFFPVSSETARLINEEAISLDAFLTLPLPRGQGIDHPPRNLSFSF